MPDQAECSAPIAIRQERERLAIEQDQAIQAHRQKKQLEQQLIDRGVIPYLADNREQDPIPATAQDLYEEVGPDQTLSHRQRKFLAAYRVKGTVAGAAEGIVCRQTHYEWMTLSATYRYWFERARLDFADVVHETAMDYAVNGVPTPKTNFNQGPFFDPATGNPILARQHSADYILKLLRLQMLARKSAPVAPPAEQLVAKSVWQKLTGSGRH